ncbi:MAG: SDR family oxidoreductase [Anaerolineae bacterium]
MAIPSFRMDGQVALVTGAGSGLGQAFAEALAAYGADVVITELPGKEAAAEATAEMVRAQGRRAMTATLDVTSMDSIRALVERVVGEWGRIDILVNNAGLNVPKWAVDVTETDWDRVLDTDLKGAFFMAQAVGRHMIERGDGGRVINITSIMGQVGFYYRAAYCSAKAGLANLTRVLAVEWAQHGINVNAIGPSFILTPLTKPMFDDPWFHDLVIDRTPQGRIGEPEDVVGAVVFLASPASKLVTGAVLMVDGGWTAW